MRFFAIIAVSVVVASTSPHADEHRYCRETTKIKDSYCKYYLKKPTCHNSKVSCNPSEVRDRLASGSHPPTTPEQVSGSKDKKKKPVVVPEGKQAPWESVTIGQRDALCQDKTENQKSYCRVKEGTEVSVCKGTDVDCSRRSVYAHLTRPASGITDALATTTTKAPKTSKTTKAPKTTTSKPSTTTTTKSPKTTASTTTTTKSPKKTTSTTTMTSTQATSSSTTAVVTPDPCAMSDAVLMGRSPTSGDSYFMPLPSMRACMENIKISHSNAIWTLHNLNFGVAETYSFTDIVTDTLSSSQSNTCNYKLHEVKVDLVGSIKRQLSTYNKLFAKMTPDQINAYLNEERPAYPFHSSLLKLLNKLHDAHTLYTTPYDMFRVYFPVTFGSSMVGGRQVITLRYSTEASSPFGRLAYVYQRVFGAPPVPASYAGAVVTHINGLPALEFLKQLVGDEGPLAASYQQLEQRLNAHIFSTQLLVLGQILATLPDFDEMVLRFSDGFEKSVKLFGQFADFSTSPYYGTPNLRSTEALSGYMHSNSAFTSFIAHESDLEAKKPTLWKYAAASANSPLNRLRGLMKAILASSRLVRISRMHKALLDPVKNFKRDHLLNLPSSIEEAGMFDSIEGVAGGASVPFVDAPTLHRVIKDALGAPVVSSGLAFTDLGGMSYSFVRDTVVVRIPSMSPEPKFDGDDMFYFFPEFVQVQQAAKAQNIKRVLFDLTDNGGGYVMSAYALLWYTMSDSTRICAPLRKRITDNWASWLESFGGGINALLDKYLVPQGAALADKRTAIFDEIMSLVNLLYDGYGFTADELGGVSKTMALARVSAKARSIALLSSKSDQAAAIVEYIRTRGFIPSEAVIKDQILPADYFRPFDPNELTILDSRKRAFTPALANYKRPEVKNWGARAAKYSQPGEYAFCYDTMQYMPTVARGYETGYWTQIAFVSDGTCGSACALFTQGIQTNGDAVAFTYGGVANTALDVASFAGGNVEEYDTFWPSLSFSSKVGRLASGGQAPYSVTQEKSWVSSPIAFPTKAGARFNWNMMFVEAMGNDALPRQFYLIPGRRHFNIWGTDDATRQSIYEEISAIENWASIPAQFAVSHGQCPLEVTPFARKQPRRTY